MKTLKNKGGRPPFYGEPMRVVVVRLRQDQWETARKLGNGVVTAGVREALNAAVAAAKPKPRRLTNLP